MKQNTKSRGPRPKRVKVVHDPPTSEPVTSSRQLKKLLACDRDLRSARHGIQSFKLLLDHMSTDGPHQEEEAILSGYLEAVRPSGTDVEPVYLPDIMQTWSFAGQIQNHELLSQVAAILALVLNVGSQYLQLLADMRGICETLLQEPQLKLVAKNLSVDPDFGFVISPALRLLREVACLDGGVFSKRIFRAQQWTFAELPRNLDVRYRGEGVEDALKPSVRTNAARFLLSVVKYLPSESKTELLSVKGLMPGLLKRMLDDPPALVHETLDSMMKDVLMDDKVPSQAKSRLFWAKLLLRLTNLYSYSHDLPDSDLSVADKTHEFLLFACTSPEAGIISGCDGFYPMSLDLTSVSHGDQTWQRMGLGQLYWMDQFTTEISVKNTAVLEATGELRPWANVKHKELLVAIFQAVPEVVAVYFREHKAFSFDPKLTMTWIGYASFVESTMQLQIPDYFGLSEDSYASVPPPTSILLDNIIPPTIDRKSLVRCFEPKWPLVSLFATRILTRALEKLEDAFRMHAEARSTTGSMTWKFASEKLLNDVSQRIPDLRDILRWYKAIPEENLLCRTSVSRLIALYYTVLPRVAVKAKNDVSPLLAKSLQKVESQKGKGNDHVMALMELENLLEMASLSPGMRWFSKLQGQSLSTFTALLRHSSGGLEGLSSQKSKEILKEIAVQHEVVLESTGLDALYRTLATLDLEKPARMEYIWSFLNSCLVRCAKSPLKYLDLAPGYAGDAYDLEKDVEVSLLAITLAEQLPFAAKSGEKKELQALSRFLSAYAANSVLMGESGAWMDALVLRMNSSLPAKAAVGLDVPEAEMLEKDTQEQKSVGEPRGRRRGSISAEQMDLQTLEEVLHEPFPAPADNVALTRWTTKSIDDLMEDGHTIALIRLLGSEHVSIRKESLTNILKMAAKVLESSYVEKDQVWLLLSELAESSKELVDRGPIPSTFTALAIHALPVLTNPLHALYPKVNKLLGKAPEWPTGKVPLIHDILHEGPTEDNSYYTEVAWLLPFLLDCLQTKADLELFRQTQWFEKLLAAACNPYIRAGLRTRVFKIIYRATCIEGGSTTLATRFAVMTWLEAQSLADDVVSHDESMMAEALMERVWATCDQDHVASWSRGGIPNMVKRIRSNER